MTPEYIGERSLAMRLHLCETKDAAIAQLVAAVRSPEQKDKLFRQWCAAKRESVHRSDLERINAGRRRELQRPLF